MKKFYLLFPALLWLLVSPAQTIKSIELGLKVTTEFSESRNDGYAIGAESIFYLNDRSSIGTGISYKFNQKKYLLLQGLSPQSRPLYSPLSQTENTILVPLFYRFTNRILSVAAGTGINILLNKKQLEKVDDPDKTDWLSNSVEILGSLSISKSLRLNKTLYIEPEIKQCFYTNGGGSGIQLNLSLRRRFAK